jgi:hypothetical protein
MSTVAAVRCVTTQPQGHVKTRYGHHNSYYIGGFT